MLFAQSLFTMQGGCVFCGFLADVHQLIGELIESNSKLFPTYTSVGLESDGQPISSIHCYVNKHAEQSKKKQNT